jgi:prepilin-type processing-associated H-X9-DG protein
MLAFIDSQWARDAYPVALKSGAANTNFPVAFCKVPNQSPCLAANPDYGRHNDGINASYMDGHVKWNKKPYFKNKGKNIPVWQGWD